MRISINRGVADSQVEGKKTNCQRLKKMAKKKEPHLGLHEVGKRLALDFVQ